MPLDEHTYGTLKKHFKLCIVSPELQGRSVETIPDFAKSLGGYRSTQSARSVLICGRIAQHLSQIDWQSKGRFWCTINRHTCRTVLIAMEQVELFEKLPHFRSRKPQLSPMPIIVGAPRSGTTLLRFMLDSHPELAIPPETGFLPILAEQAISGTATAESYYTTITNTPLQSPAWPDFSLDASAFEKSLRSLRPFDPTEATRRFYRQYADRFAKKRCGEKTPMYSVHMPAIETLLPEAAFIHLIRDGRDASLSLRPLWFSPSADISELAEQWKSTVVKARQDSTLVRKYLEIRYEDLLTSPTKILSTICSFLEMPYSSCMEAYYQRTPERLREHLGRKNANGTTWLTQEQRISQQWRTTLPPDTSRIGVWRTQMSQEDHALFRNVAGPLLSDLGYE